MWYFMLCDVTSYSAVFSYSDFCFSFCLSQVLHVRWLHCLRLLVGEGVRLDQSHHPQALQRSQVPCVTVWHSDPQCSHPLSVKSNPSLCPLSFLPPGAPWVWRTVPSSTTSVHTSVTRYVWMTTVDRPVYFKFPSPHVIKLDFWYRTDSLNCHCKQYAVFMIFFMFDLFSFFTQIPSVVCGIFSHVGHCLFSSFCLFSSRACFLTRPTVSTQAKSSSVPPRFSLMCSGCQGSNLFSAESASSGWW